MEQKTMGVVLNYYRKKYKLKQEDVCSGICSIATFSRLEQGYREIDSLMGELLLGRVGKEVTLFETLLNEEDYILWEKRDNIKKLIAKCDYINAKKELINYRKIMPKEESIHEQFCLYQEALILIGNGEYGKKICNILEKGISISIPSFRSGDVEDKLYNLTEIEMILLLIHYANNDNKAEKKLLQLLDYVNRYYSDRKKEEVGVKIFLELINLQNKNILLYVDQAIKLIGNGKGFYNLGNLYFLKAQTIERIFGKSEKWEICKNECIEICKMAYYLYKLNDDENNRLRVIEFCEEKLECQITGAEM